MAGEWLAGGELAQILWILQPEPAQDASPTARARAELHGLAPSFELART